MGGFYPPADQAMFIHADLKALGFPRGSTPFSSPAKYGGDTPCKNGRGVRVGRMNVLEGFESEAQAWGISLADRYDLETLCRPSLKPLEKFTD